VTALMNSDKIELYTIIFSMDGFMLIDMILDSAASAHLLRNYYILFSDMNAEYLFCCPKCNVAALHLHILNQY
jgi:hypothetical protein